MLYPQPPSIRAIQASEKRDATQQYHYPDTNDHVRE
jgi:hypothetical protein